MIAWDKFWVRFDAMMDAVPDMVDEAVEGAIPGMVSTQITDGHVVINGEVQSLKINGYQVRVPSHVMRGAKK